MRIVAFGGAKGGVGKTTLCVTLAAIACRAGLDVLVVDGDVNRSSTDLIEHAELPVEVVDGRNPDALRKLRAVGGRDLAMVDLPGTSDGALQAILRGAESPVCDLLVAPTAPEAIELRPTLRLIRGDVMPLAVTHMVVFTRVRTPSVPRARERQAELRGLGITVANTIIRNFTVYDEAVERHAVVLDLPGAHSYARQAELDCRSLAAEVLVAGGMR